MKMAGWLAQGKDGTSRTSGTASHAFTPLPESASFAFTGRSRAWKVLRKRSAHILHCRHRRCGKNAALETSDPKESLNPEPRPGA